MRIMTLKERKEIKVGDIVKFKTNGGTYVDAKVKQVIDINSSMPNFNVHNLFTGNMNYNVLTLYVEY